VVVTTFALHKILVNATMGFGFKAMSILITSGNSRRLCLNDQNQLIIKSTRKWKMDGSRDWGQ
jgi:hypothetical protein